MSNSTVAINFRTDEKEKINFFKNTKKMGISASTLLNMFIKNFNRSKKVTFSLDGEINLEPFVPGEVETIVEDFEKTGKYNKNFLKDLENGLKRSKINKKLC